LQRVILASAGIAIGTALVAIIRIFASSSAGTMTQRALAEVPVDWQVAVTLSAAAPVLTARVVGYADAASLEATTNGTTQTTGAGQALGIDSDYMRTFPKQVRLLLGSLDGVLIAQQTAANLHVGIGDTVSILRDGEPHSEVTIDGIVDLPNADAMFQVIGPARGSRAHSTARQHPAAPKGSVDKSFCR
jgi:putative ABC transport system permease protein